MELTFARCEQIMNTLPIGYYTGRRIAISLDAKESTSFYSPMEDTIVISYPIIAERCKKMTAGTDEEGAVRAMLYHEVSHAILTPQEMKAEDIVNIFEDERIESVLRNYYHNVDFRKQLYDLHGGQPPKADSAIKAFYNAVRFGLGTGKVLKEINRIIKKASTINRATPYYSYDGIYDVNHYVYDIRRLYDLINQEFADNPEAFQPQSGNGNGEMQQMDSLKNQQQNGNQNQNGEKQNGEGQEEGEENMPASIGDPEHEIEANAEQIKRMVGASLSKKPDLSESQQEKLNEFQKTVETIIGNFNKKNSGGSGINTYSGVFNPRAVARKDYRFFERSMSTQGNNKFGTCHLNLIIDCSGSYSDNVPLTNGILSVLSEVERKNRNFSMDVLFINHELHPCKTIRDRKMDAYGGNRIPPEMKQILLDLQKQNTCNYNIILFDGDAMCNNHDLRGIDSYRKRFGVFDMKQTTLITDPDNETYIDGGFTSTKVVVTKNYTEELIKNVTRALTIAFG